MCQSIKTRVVNGRQTGACEGLRPLRGSAPLADAARYQTTGIRKQSFGLKVTFPGAPYGKQRSMIDYCAPTDMTLPQILASLPGVPSLEAIRDEYLRQLNPWNMSYQTLSSLVDERIPTLEVAAAALLDVVSCLRELRNTGIGIARMPPELLSRVFSSFIGQEDTDTDLVSVTHVCRRWRAIALSNPNLWNHVFVTSLEKAATFIERSGDQPLNIYFENYHLAKQFAPTLRPEAHRLRTLVSRPPRGHLSVYLMAALSCISAPQLQNLHLLSREPPERDESVLSMFGRGVDMFKSVDNRFIFDTSALRSLRLYEVAIPWEIDIYKNLTVLELCTPSMVPPTLRRLLECLRQCPDLEELNLELSDISELSVPSNDPNWNVDLRRLASLNLVLPKSRTVSTFLSCLILPPQTRCGFRFCQELEGFPSPDYPMIPRDRSRLPGLSVFDRVHVSVTDLFRVDASCMRIKCYHPTISGIDDPTLVLVLMETSNPAVALSMLGESIDLASVHTFSVTGAQGSSVMWASLFRFGSAFCTLHIVEPRPGAVEAIFRALATPSTDAGGQPGGLCCGALQVLELVGVRMTGPVYEAILHGCTVRKVMGAGLERLVLLKVNVVDELWMRRLQEVGVEVHVNSSN